jgi:hypothetical protein
MSSDKLVEVGDMVVDEGRVLVVVKEHAMAGCCVLEDAIDGKHYYMDRYVAYALKQNQSAGKTD